jgi:hypothetical protein
VDAVDHQVDVRMVRVAVRDDQRLMLLQAEVIEQAVGNLHHRRAVHRIRRVERKGDVVYRPLDPVGACCRRSHEEA